MAKDLVWVSEDDEHGIEKKVEVESSINKKQPRRVERKEQIVKEEPKESLPLAEQTLQNASYLVDTLDVKFNRAFKFSQQHPGLSKQDLLNLYLNPK